MMIEALLFKIQEGCGADVRISTSLANASATKVLTVDLETC
jgi:hypothetical protein